MNHHCASARRVLLAGAAAGVLFTATGAMAQITPGPAGVPAATPGVEEVVVTGSKIARKDTDSVGPLTTLTAQDITDTASFSIGDILQKLPGAGVSYDSNGSQGTSYGASSINLRYLANTDGDADRTLVLVDGHRWVDGTGARGIRDFVDLNTIPIGIVGNIEVLQDGASAIYGADAIAGVVNIHTVQNLDGFNVSAKTGESSRGDGAEYSAFANWGMPIDHGSVFVSASFVQDNATSTLSRSISSQSLAAGPSNLSAPGTSPRGLYVLPGFSTTAAPITQNVGTTIATSAANYHVATLPADYYDTQAQGFDDTGPEEKYGLYARATDEVLPGITLTVDALYNRRISSQLLSPTLLSIGGTGGTDKGFSIAANQIYNPFQTGFTASQAWTAQIVTNAVGLRSSDEDTRNYHFSGTLQGDVPVLGRDFTWTAFASYAQNSMHFTSPNQIDLEHLQLGLSSPTVCAAAPGCVPINIFGQMDATQAAYIRDIAHETNDTKLFDSTFDVTGKIFDLPAGPLAMAAGLEYRRTAGHDNPDVYTNTTSTGSGLLPLPATTPTDTGQTRTPTSNGYYEVREGYTEFSAPIIKDVPLIQSLDLDAAVRYSEYSTHASRLTSKVGIGYRPIQDLLLRGTFSQGFRAPSLIELYTGSRQTTLAGTNTDPCSGGAAAHPTLPGCAGIPSTYVQVTNVPETISGNTKLKPEVAETFSYGVAYTPEWLPGASLTSDWYTVTIYRAISQPAAATALQLCASQGGSACSVVIRDPVGGQITNFLSSYENLNRIRTQGLDTTLRYNFDTSIGNWDASLGSTFLNNFTVVSPNPLGGAPLVTQAAGTSTGGTTPATARATYPHWKLQGALHWNDDGWGVLWRSRYIGETHDGAAPALPVVPVKDAFVHEVVYNDIQVDYTIEDESANVAVGMNNIFDVMPPASYANVPINFDIYTYDPMGRYFYLRLQKKF